MSGVGSGESTVQWPCGLPVYACLSVACDNVITSSHKTDLGSLEDGAEGEEHERRQDGQDRVQVAAPQLLALARLAAHHALNRQGGGNQPNRRSPRTQANRLTD